MLAGKFVLPFLEGLLRPISWTLCGVGDWTTKETVLSKRNRTRRGTLCARPDVSVVPFPILLAFARRARSPQLVDRHCWCT